jgi:hypothetical protein
MSLGELYSRFEKCLAAFERLATSHRSYLRTNEAREKLRLIELQLGDIADDLTLFSMQHHDKK